jgi:type II secretory pathway predicted ATPase ExeA
MYQEFYGFTRLPFDKDIPPNDLFAAPDQQELAGRLTFLLRQHGLGLVTGEIGAGKSTAIRGFTAQLDPNRFLLIYLPNPTIGMNGLYRDILTALHYEAPYSRPKLVAAIRAAFSDLVQSRRRFPLLVIDEAHLLPPDAFEQFRLLLSDQMDSHSLASLLLVGQPVLRDTLRLAGNQAFYQRLTIRYHLQPLDLQNAIAYIKHHVRIAGFQGGQLFSDDALGRIFDYTKGVPRQINLLCTTALLAGMIDQKSILDESTIRKAIADIDRH